MNVTTKSWTVYSLGEVTQAQAQDLLQTAIKIDAGKPLDADEKETLSNLRQAILAAGIIPKRAEHGAD